MPRKPRFYLPGIPAHVIQRGNSRQTVFFRDEDYSAYLKWLQEGALQHGCEIHAYVLMTNHVHLLMTPLSRDSISQTIQYVGRYYVAYINRRYGRSGTLWEGRHKGCIVSDDRYLLTCMQYIELNPVRAGMVQSPGEYRWSSYQNNATGRAGKIIVPHVLYQTLGVSTESRGKVYREMFPQALATGQMQDIRATVQTGTPLGSEQFLKEVESALACKVGQSRRGRPAKVADKGY